MTVVFFVMIAVGMMLLALSLPVIASMMRILGKGRLRWRWLWLRGLIIAFLFGYAVFGALHVATVAVTADLEAVMDL